MRQLRNGTRGKVPRLADRQKLILILYQWQNRQAALDHEIIHLKGLIRSDYWSVHDVTEATRIQKENRILSPRRKRK